MCQWIDTTASRGPLCLPIAQAGQEMSSLESRAGIKGTETCRGHWGICKVAFLSGSLCQGQLGL